MEWMMIAKWKYIDVAKWYDCKLGKYYDQELARLVGTTPSRIKRRRELFGIPPYSINQAIEPYAHLVGFWSDRALAEKCGASVTSVRMYREARGIEPRAKVSPKQPRLPQGHPVQPPKQQGLPQGHPVQPFKDALRLVPAEDVAIAANVTLQEVLEVCAALGIKPPKADAKPCVHLQDVPGPLIGYESLFGKMSSAKISRAVGVPLGVIEQRRIDLGLPRYERISKAERYRHLFGLLPNAVIAKLAGVTTGRIADMRKVKSTHW